jgi:hypothetical protein
LVFFTAPFSFFLFTLHAANHASANQVRWRANFRNGWLGDDPKLFASRMAAECVAARRYLKADVFSHCQPQTNYLYRGAAHRAEEASAAHTPTARANNAAGQEAGVPEAGAAGLEPLPLMPACDYVLADPSAHARLLKHLLPRRLPPARVNFSENKTDANAHWPGLSLQEVSERRSASRCLGRATTCCPCSF